MIELKPRVVKSPGRLLSRRAVAREAAGASALAAVGITAVNGNAFAQGYGGKTVGVAEGGAISIEFVGSIYQQAFDFTVFGFLTYVSGLDPKYLFTDDDAANRSPAAARFTLYGKGKGIGRTIHQTLFSVDAVGEMGIYFNEKGGASFDEPESLAVGDKIATLLMRIQNIVDVTAPKTGLCTGFGDLTFDETSPFETGDETYTVGEEGSLARITYTGQGVLIDPELPESLIAVAGNFRF